MRFSHLTEAAIASLLDDGWKATDIARVLRVSSSAVYSRKNASVAAWVIRMAAEMELSDAPDEAENAEVRCGAIPEMPESFFYSQGDLAE